MDQIDKAEGPSDENTRAYLLPGDPSSSRPSYPRSPRGSQSSRRPSIRIRRLSSTSSLHNDVQIQVNGQEVSNNNADEDQDSWPQTRRRSSSEPRPGRWSAPPEIALSNLATGNSQMRMTSVAEETSSPNPTLDASSHVPERLAPPPPAAGQGNRHLLRRASGVALQRLSRNRASTISAGHGTARDQRLSEYDQQFVDFLDVVDPEIATLSTLTNVQNSLFVPDLGRYLNRTPTYTLTRHESETSVSGSTTSEDTFERPQEEEDIPLDKDHATTERLRTLSTITSALSESRFAVLPEGSSLEGWSVEDIRELNDHVRHMLHSRRSKFKRSMRGFGKYVSKPLGFLVFLYATLITLFGLAWVLFLIGWINVGGRQLYIINVIDNVLVALFAVMGDGLAPFRAVDTYHMIFIAHYHHLTWKLRKKRALPKLQDRNDLPSMRETEVDVEDIGDTKQDQLEFTVLTPLQQKRLVHHQNKFAKSHTFYKPHETMTHHAFPLRLLIAVVVLLDFHSIFQIALGTCTWSINYHVRPFALTTVILCCSITCNISAGVVIMIGDRMTRKKDVVERLLRQQLTQEAMRKMDKRKRKEERRKAELEAAQPYAGT